MNTKTDWLKNLSWDAICAPIASAIVANKIGEIISDSSYKVVTIDGETYLQSLPISFHQVFNEAIIMFCLFFLLWFLFRYGFQFLLSIFFRYKTIRKNSEKEILDCYLKERKNIFYIEEQIKKTEKSDAALIHYFRDYVTSLIHLRAVFYSPTQSQMKKIKKCFRSSELLSINQFPYSIPVYEYNELMHSIKILYQLFERTDNSIIKQDCEKLLQWINYLSDLTK